MKERFSATCRHIPVALRLGIAVHMPRLQVTDISRHRQSSVTAAGVSARDSNSRGGGWTDRKRDVLQNRYDPPTSESPFPSTPLLTTWSISAYLYPSGSSTSDLTSLSCPAPPTVAPSLLPRSRQATRCRRSQVMDSFPQPCRSRLGNGFLLKLRCKPSSHCPS